MLGVKSDSLQASLDDHGPKLQSRKVRFQSLGYLFLFICWNIGVIGFIMYRVRGDDLEQLEIEAKERIKSMKTNKDYKSKNQ